MRLYCSIPVGMYHHVNENKRDFITVSTDNFEAQMHMLALRGYQTLSAAEFRECKLGRRPVPPRAVLLTFDDAWLDVYVNAFPILKKYGHHFTVFAVTEWIESAGGSPPSVLPRQFPTHSEAERLLFSTRINEVMCNWDHLREMQASGLCSVENHTSSHETHRILGNRELLRDHIRRGQAALREKLGIESRQLCWPRGRTSREGLRAAAELGIDVTYLVRRGVNMPIGDAMSVKRFTVDDYDGDTLESWLKLFAAPLRGYVYSRLKPDRWLKKWRQARRR